MKQAHWDLFRQVRNVAFTLGVLIGGGTYLYTVEDAVRPLVHCTATTCDGKIPGLTAIPPGTYQIKDTYSPKYKRNVLQLMDVPGFQGIRIHSGNSADDTEGCLVLGQKRTPTGVAYSNAALVEFNKKVREQLKSGPVSITIHP